MAPFLFRCPATGLQVQTWIADSPPSDGESYETVMCQACRQIHLVNPKDGKTLGADED